jgi:hypothetical protein
MFGLGRFDSTAYVPYLSPSIFDGTFTFFVNPAQLEANPEVQLSSRIPDFPTF